MNNKTNADSLAMPKDLAIQILNALAHAMTICDAVPSRAHDLADDHDLRGIGKLVNHQEDTGAYGYALIRDAEKELQNFIIEGNNITQAAANKAAEEGGLPALPHTTYNGYSDGSEPLWTKEQMHGYATLAIAADRASRQVANKAEVDLSSLRKYAPFISTGNAFTHDQADMDEDADGKYVKLDDVKILLAAPPATTGASVSTLDSLPDLMDEWVEAARGANALAVYAKIEALIDQHVAREVAAQAGQVAVPIEAQVAWSIDLQARLIALGNDQADDVRNVMSEAACLLASLTGGQASTSGERQEGGAA